MPLIGSVLNYQVDSGSVLLAGAIQVRRLQRAAQDTGRSGHGPLRTRASQDTARSVKLHGRLSLELQAGWRRHKAGHEATKMLVFLGGMSDSHEISERNQSRNLGGCP